MAFPSREALTLACVGFAALLANCGGSSETNVREIVVGTAGSGGSSGGSPMGKAGTSSEAGAPPLHCAAPTLGDFAPHWSPPHAAPGSCTTAQITQKYDVCDRGSPLVDDYACRVFDNDPANADCLGCLFSAVDADASGPLQVIHEYWIANLGGCVALVDGDSGPDSCGAREQAEWNCEYIACAEACPLAPPADAWSECIAAARKICAQYRSKTSCVELPKYAACWRDTFADYFKAYGEQFCGSGSLLSPTPPGEGGAAQAGGGGAGGAP